MKRFGTIAVIAGLLLAAALFYRSRADEGKTGTPAPAKHWSKDLVSPPRPHDTPITEAEAKGLLTLKAQSSHGYVAADANGEVFVAVDVSAQKVEGDEVARPPLNIALAIDRSGSMYGPPMEYAKAAAIAVIDELGPEDRVALVSYATDVSVTFESQPATPAAKARMRSAIHELRAAGGTNIGDGYTYAFQQVKRHASERTVNRVILVSDGEPTVGATEPRVLMNMAGEYRRQGVSLTTIGVGLDYHEDLMAGMADQGAGNYYFVDAPETAITIFQDELFSLTRTIARNTTVTLELGEGVSLKEISGFDYQLDGRTIVVPLAEFRSDENKNILLTLGVDPARDGLFPLLNTALSYQDLRDEKDYTARVALKSLRTADAALLASGINVAVIDRVRQVEIARSMQEAMTAYEAGRDEEAREVIQRTQKKARGMRETYKLNSPAAVEAGAQLEHSMRMLSAPAAPRAARQRAAKEMKLKGRNMQKSAAIELW